MYDILKKEMEERPGLKARQPGREARETLLEELKIVRGYLARSEQRFRLYPPLTGKCFGSVDYIQIIKMKTQNCLPSNLFNQNPQERSLGTTGSPV